MCVWQAGIYWISLTDTFASNWVLLIICLVEVIGFIYVYGMAKMENCLSATSIHHLPAAELVSCATLPNIDNKKKYLGGYGHFLIDSLWSTQPCRHIPRHKRQLLNTPILISLFSLLTPSAWLDLRPIDCVPHTLCRRETFCWRRRDDGWQEELLFLAAPGKHAGISSVHPFLLWVWSPPCYLLE